MKAAGIVVLSFAGHLVSFLLFLWVGLLLGGIKPLLPLLVGHLFVVAGLGYVKAVRWPSRWHGAFATGLAAAAVGATLAVIGLEYALSFPVPDRLAPPPFWNYVVEHELRRKNALVWMMIPMVVWSMTSAGGYHLAEAACEGPGWPHNNEMKLTKPATARTARSSQLISVLGCVRA